MIKSTPFSRLYVVAHHYRSHTLEWGDVHVEDWMPYDEWSLRADIGYFGSCNLNMGGQTVHELPYAAEHVHVYQNGVMLPDYEYTIQSRVFTLAATPAIDDVITITFGGNHG